jgi:uncharacterized membrane protein
LEIDGREGDGGGFIEPLLGFGGFLLTIALLILTVVLLRRYGLIPDQLPFTRRPAPEDSARQLLAERMAKGEVSTEEFLDRASALNWTPGSDLKPGRTRLRRP